MTQKVAKEGIREGQKDLVGAVGVGVVVGVALQAENDTVGQQPVAVPAVLHRRLFMPATTQQRNPPPLSDNSSMPKHWPAVIHAPLHFSVRNSCGMVQLLRCGCTGRAHDAAPLSCQGLRPL